MGSAASSSQQYAVEDVLAASPEEISDSFWTKLPQEEQEAVKNKLVASMGIHRPGTKIAYLCDVEGHWPFFCNYINNAEGLRFANAGNDSTRHTEKDLDIELIEGWQFVFGGDACDKGPGTLRFLESMVRLKRKYPNRVTLLMGNRDINKIRWTAEVAESELAIERVKQCPAAFWLGKKTTFLDYLTGLAASKHGVEREAVTDAMLKELSTKVNKFRYMLDYDMGSRGEFDFRRQELAIIKEVPESDISDDDVVKSYLQSVDVGGWMREYLNAAQLGAIVHTTLFVHGQIVNGCSLSDHTNCLGMVPGEEQPIANVRQWLSKLNAWGASQVREWKEKPEWVTPPTESTFTSWKGRGGSDLIAYGTPGSQWPTVVYCRYLTKSCMPIPMPPEVCHCLKSQGIFNLVVGHTPHGTAPTALRSNGVVMVMGDTSFSDMKCNEAFKGDNRGRAVFDIAFNGETWAAAGSTEKVDEIVQYDMHSSAGDPLIGKFVQEDCSGKDFFFKAKLSGNRYLLSHIDGFSYKYAVLHEYDAIMAFRQQKFHAIVQDGPMQNVHEDGFSRLQLILDTIKSNKGLAATLDKDSDDTISAGELLAALSNRLDRHSLIREFPNLDIGALMQDLAGMMSTNLTLEDLAQRCETTTIPAGMSAGIYFPISEGSEGADDFPRSLGSLAMVSTRAILPSDVTVFKEEVQDWMRVGKYSTLQLANAKKTELEKLDGWPDTKTIFMSALSKLTLSDDVRKSLGIPSEAVYFSFIYPCAHSLESWTLDSAAMQSPDLALLGLGGFAYLDDKYTLVKILALLDKKASSDEAAPRIAFGPPQKLTDRWIQDAIRLGTFHQLTLRPLLDRGVTDFSWVPPGVVCKKGGFAYLGSGLSVGAE